MFQLSVGKNSFVKISTLSENDPKALNKLVMSFYANESNTHDNEESEYDP